MCRWLSYSGKPRFIESLVCEPTHSLIAQSRDARECKAGTNGDGFGIGWYGERKTPGLYRCVMPAWSDENLRSLVGQVRAPVFFAHVRAATGTPTSHANCHPFAVGRHLFMHNGQIGGYAKIRRQLEQMIPDELYDHRVGTTDSEALFLAAMGNGLVRDPIAALKTTLEGTLHLMREKAIRQPLRFAAAATDGEATIAVRLATDGRAPSLYLREDAEGTTISSECLDADRRGWTPVPCGHAVIVSRHGSARIEPMPVAGFRGDSSKSESGPAFQSLEAVSHRNARPDPVLAT